MMKEVLKGIALMVILAGAFTTCGMGHKEYTINTATHVAREGQTLWGIATKYMPEQEKTRDVRELVHDIEQANGLRNKYIQPGMVLAIPLAREVKK